MYLQCRQVSTQDVGWLCNVLHYGDSASAQQPPPLQGGRFESPAGSCRYRHDASSAFSVVEPLIVHALEQLKGVPGLHWPPDSSNT